MTDYKDRLAGAAAGTASVAAVGTAVAVQLAASSGERIAFTAQAAGVISYGPLASVNATTQVIAQLPSGAIFEERDYRGPIFARAELDAVIVRTWVV